MHRAIFLAPLMRGAMSSRAFQCVRYMTTPTDPDASRQTEFRRPKGIEWPDSAGKVHFTEAIKTSDIIINPCRMAVYTGNPDDRVPVDPYAPDVTPSQMARLNSAEKQKVADLSQKLKAMSTKAYEKINMSTKLNMEIEKDAEQAAAFADIMRRWSSKAYESVDKETEKASEDKKKRLDLASKLRSMNPGAYEQLDTVAKAEFHKGKGVSWTDSSGAVHDTPLVKKKMQSRLGSASDLPPSDPYRAGAP